MTHHSPTAERADNGDAELCLECGAKATGRFCANCGAEKRAPLRPFQEWLSDIFGQVIDLDIRLLRTLPRLFFSPGLLTVEYSAGRRQRYTSPIRLYVVASAIIIAAMNLLDVFQLDVLLADASEEERAAMAAAFGIADLSDPELQESFNQRMDLVFPILNLFSPVGMMLLLKLLYWRRYLQEHLAFACHYVTALVVVTLPLLMVEGVALQIMTSVVTIGLLLYLVVAMRRVYRGSWTGLIARLVVLAVGLLAIITVLQSLTFSIVLGTL